MTPEDLSGLAIVVSFFVLLAVEAAFPARAYPARRFWRLRGVVQLIFIGALAALIPAVLPMQAMTRHRLVDLSQLGVVPGTLVGYLAVSFVTYAFHRSTHRFPVLWRTFHQLHHAPQRLDMAGATVFHPFDIAAYMVLSTVVTTWVLGLSSETAATTSFVAQFYAYFQHLNVRTPRWLGYVIQRPESHFVHHQKDVHGFNYADLPLWDMLFGTFRNPETFGTGEVGFGDEAEASVGAMLALRDVSSSVGTRVPEADTVGFSPAE